MKVLRPRACSIDVLWFACIAAHSGGVQQGAMLWPGLFYNVAGINGQYAQSIKCAKTTMLCCVFRARLWPMHLLISQSCVQQSAESSMCCSTAEDDCVVGNL